MSEMNLDPKSQQRFDDVLKLALARYLMLTGSVRALRDAKTIDLKAFLAALMPQDAEYKIMQDAAYEIAKADLDRSVKNVADKIERSSSHGSKEENSESGTKEESKEIVNET